MSDYITVKIYKDDVLDMLIARLKDRWTDDDDVIELYEQMYDGYLENGVFDYQEFDVNSIVDNDYVNYCDVIDEDDYRYSEIKEAYENGEYEPESGNIESVLELGDGTAYKFLIRAWVQ